MSRTDEIDKIVDEIGDADSLYKFAEGIYEDRQRIAELEEQLKNARKETAKKVIARVEELGVFDFEAYEERYIISEKELDNILKEYEK